MVVMNEKIVEGIINNATGVVSKVNNKAPHIIQLVASALLLLLVTYALLFVACKLKPMLKFLIAVSLIVLISFFALSFLK